MSTWTALGFHFLLKSFQFFIDGGLLAAIVDESHLQLKKTFKTFSFFVTKDQGLYS
jgi:hypothetical protein